MSRGQRKRMISRMTADPIRIVLDIEVLDESPIGHATTIDGTSRSFTGWLGLLSVLEALLPDPRYSDDEAVR